MFNTLKDIFLFSDYCWESTNGRIRNIALSLIKKNRVFIVESPILGMTGFAKLTEHFAPEGVIVLTPYLPLKTNEADKNIITQELITNYINQENIIFFDNWYFSSTPWEFSKNLGASSITYHIDKLDDLNTPLASSADFVFSSHPLSDPRCVYIADGVDFEHFSQARLSLISPDDLVGIPSPRIGCYGILDDSLIEKLAVLRPDLQFIFLQAEGEIHLDNVHYLGVKNFYSLPLYMSHWDAAFTQLPERHLLELLCGARPTVLISENPLLDQSLVLSAADPSEMSRKIDKALNLTNYDPHWIDRVDLYLESKSWDHQVDLMLKKQETIDTIDYQQETLTH